VRAKRLLPTPASTPAARGIAARAMGGSRPSLVAQLHAGPCKVALARPARPTGGVPGSGGDPGAANSSAVMRVMLRSADMSVVAGRSPPCGRPSNGMMFVTARPSSSPDPIVCCCSYGGRQRSAARPPLLGVCSSSGLEAPASLRSARTVASSSPCRCSSGTTKPSTRSRSCMSSVIASSTAACS